MVKTYLPKQLSPARYDSYLASGWYRGSTMLYKMQLLCIDNRVCSVVNIRLNLLQHQARKSHRKLFAKNQRRFTTVVSRAKIDQARNRLYLESKHKFKGFVHHSLSEYLHAGLFETVFNTYEVAVYDGERLVAISYFDLGDKAVASLIGLYDETYNQHSLGIYTMLCEVDWATKRNIKYYYPGYILDVDPYFNYKLELGNFEYYNAKKRWSHYKNFKISETISADFNQAMDQIEELLKTWNIPYDRLLYPYFSMGYMIYWANYYVKEPAFFVLKSSEGIMRIASYDLNEKRFLLMNVGRDADVQRFIQMEISEDLHSEHVYAQEVLFYKQMLRSGEKASDIIF